MTKARDPPVIMRGPVCRSLWPPHCYNRTGQISAKLLYTCPATRHLLFPDLVWEILLRGSHHLRGPHPYPSKFWARLLPLLISLFPLLRETIFFSYFHSLNQFGSSKNYCFEGGEKLIVILRTLLGYLSPPTSIYTPTIRV